MQHAQDFAGELLPVLGDVGGASFYMTKKLSLIVNNCKKAYLFIVYSIS